MANDIRMGVDIAKSVLEIAVAAHDRPGKVARRERLSRSGFLVFMAQQPKAIVFMEACGSAHYWGASSRAWGIGSSCCPLTR